MEKILDGIFSGMASIMFVVAVITALSLGSWAGYNMFKDIFRREIQNKWLRFIVGIITLCVAIGIILAILYGIGSLISI